MRLIFILLSLTLNSSPMAWAQGSPAAKNCNAMGGMYQTTSSPEEIGFCTFGKSSIGTWTLFRFTHGQIQKAVTAFCSSHDNPNNRGVIPGPEVEYCQHVGGQSILYTEMDGSLITFCSFSDNSHIELGTLFFGVFDPQSAQLNKILCCRSGATGC
jgi:putative hemolysin